MVSHRQKALLLNAEAVSRSERLPDCFFCVEAVAVHGIDALAREQRPDGELLLRFDGGASTLDNVGEAGTADLVPDRQAAAAARDSPQP